MHIAICDDNIADRKHLERLLSRESDKRQGTPDILYVDSYGDWDNFFHNPFLYDMFFIDMVSQPDLAKKMVLKLREMDINAPIVMYSSKIDYESVDGLPQDIVFMKKPYIPEPLPELLKLGDAHVIGHIETIPLHCPDVLHAVAIRDIFYIYTTKENRFMLCLKNGSLIEIKEDIGALQLALAPYHEFMRITKKVIVNLKLVTLITPFSIMMQDYKEFYYSPFRYKEMKEAKDSIDVYE